IPTLQVALDFLELSRALGVAREAWKGGATWIEAGTPLLKSEGLESIRALRREFPKAYIIADTKTLDAGRTEFEAAAKAGANCETAPAMVKAGAQIVIVGGAISKSADAAGATKTLLKAIREGKGAASELYKRGSSDEEIRAILHKVSTPNLSDAMHRSGDLPGIE